MADCPQIQADIGAEFDEVFSTPVQFAINLANIAALLPTRGSPMFRLIYSSPNCPAQNASCSVENSLVTLMVLIIE